MSPETESWSPAKPLGAVGPGLQFSRTFPKASESEILGEIDQTGKVAQVLSSEFNL